MAEHCEKHGFDHWPRRNDPLRATVVPQLSKKSKEEMNHTMSRCRSLEFLEDRKFIDKKFDQSIAKGTFRRSFEVFDLLNNIEQHEAIIHHSMMTDLETSKSSSMQRSTNTSESGLTSLQRHCTLEFREKCDNVTHDTLSAESLKDFTRQTKEMIQMKRALQQKSKEKTDIELRERQKADNSFLKFPPNFSSTLMSNSIDDLHEYHSSNHYPNDFDDISVEMKNITKLLSASIIEPLESAPSTSSSFYQSTGKLSKRFTLYDKDGGLSNDKGQDDEDDDDDDDNDNHYTNSQNSYGNRLSGLNSNNPSGNGLTINGFFQNTCFETRSSSSCDTLKSVEMSKMNGKNDINGNADDDEDEDDTELEDADEPSTKTPRHIQSYTHCNPRPSLVSARIKSLLSKNLQTVNKRPTVRSSLAVGNPSKSAKLLRIPTKTSDPQKLLTTETNADGANSKNVDTTKMKDSSENEAQITVLKATVHTNQMQTNPNNGHTNTANK